MKKYAYIFPVLSLAPALSFAADWSLSDSTFSGVIGYVLKLLNLVIPILFIGAFIFFFWGLSKFILNTKGNQAELEKGKNYMMWGILALFIMITYRVFVAMFSGEFGFKNVNDIKHVLPESDSSSMNIQTPNHNIIV